MLTGAASERSGWFRDWTILPAMIVLRMATVPLPGSPHIIPPPLVPAMFPEIVLFSITTEPVKPENEQEMPPPLNSALLSKIVLFWMIVEPILKVPSTLIAAAPLPLFA